MTNLISRMFQDQEVRFVGTADRLEWVAADIVTILYPEADRHSYSKYLEKIQPEWKGKKKVATPGGIQAVTTIYEPGFYILIARSNSPIALPFQKWMFEEVLPAIRRDYFGIAPSIAVNTAPVAFGDLSWQEQVAAAIALAKVPGAVDALAMLKGDPTQKAKPTKKAPKPKQPQKEALYIPGWAAVKPRGSWTDEDVLNYVRLRNEVEPLTVVDAYRLSRTLQRQKIGVYRLAAAIRSL